MIGLLYFFLAVLVHELGHYAVARWYGVQDMTVCIFFNPYFSLLRFRLFGTTWCIGWLPIGGYTDIPGFTGFWPQLQYNIASAGIVANLLCSIVCILAGWSIQLAAINTLLAAISMLPFAPYDGAYIFKRRDNENE